MYSRWSNVAVVVFWLITMGWLVEDKILPSLSVGEPPTYRSILSEEPAHQEPVFWNVFLNGRPLGRAELSRRTLDQGVAELRSQVRLDGLPLAEITPGWMNSLMRLASGSREWAQLVLTVESDSRLEIDPLGRPMGFYSRTWLGERDSWPASGLRGMTSPSGILQITLQGTVEGQQLKLKVRSGHLIYNTSAYLPADALISDAFSPQARLPNLKVGQSWAVPLYSPLHPPTAPMELMRATVVRREPISWGGQVVPTYLVDFSADPGGGMTGNQASRAKAWVGADGLVLKQEMTLLSARLTFERVGQVDQSSPGHKGQSSPATRESDP